MLNDTDTVGYAFKRAFYRVDGVTMYVFWVIWTGILIWTMFDAEASGMEVLGTLMIGLFNHSFMCCRVLCGCLAC